MKRVTIFGEDSLLGRAISDILEKDKNYDIVNSYSHPYPLLPRKKHYPHCWSEELDAADYLVVQHLVASSDIVVNCSGLVGTEKCKDSSYGAYYSNILTAQTVAKACKEHNVKMVHFGTTASYNSKFPITEKEPPALFQTIYSGTKLVGESVVREILGENALIVRPCFVFGGKRDESSVIKKLVQRHVENKHPFWEITLSLQNKKDYLWIEDFADAMKLLIDGDHSGTFNISKGESVVYSDLLKELANFGIVPKNVYWNDTLDYLGNHEVKNKKIKALGWSPKTSIMEGIGKILHEYETDFVRRNFRFG